MNYSAFFNDNNKAASMLELIPNINEILPPNQICASFVDFEKTFDRVGLWQMYGTIIEIT